MPSIYDETFCEKSEDLKAFNSFRIKTPSYMFERALITPR